MLYEIFNTDDILRKVNFGGEVEEINYPTLQARKQNEIICCTINPFSAQ